MRYVNATPWTVPFGPCPLHSNTISPKEKFLLKDGFSVSTIQRLMRFSASHRLATIPLSSLFFQFPLVGHIMLLLGRTLLFRNSCFFL